MSPSVLTNIKQLFKIQMKMDESEIIKYVSFLENYNKGMWIYPGVIKRKLNVPISDVYNCLYCLEQAGILCGYFELYCNNCQHSTGNTFEAFNQIPNEFECEICNHIFSGVENTILIYKVIAE